MKIITEAAARWGHCKNTKHSLQFKPLTRFSFIWHFLLSTILMSCGQKVKTTSKDFKVLTTDSVQLALTLTKPIELKKTPLLIIVHGSGNDSRENEYYKMLTNEFCSIGCSVITYDKRGCDSSTGNWLSVPFSYLKDDVVGIANTFARDTTITQIGLWGGSEGSNVAVWAASESKDIDFVIAQSFTAMTFAEQNKFVQLNRIKNYSNVSEQKINELMNLQDLLYEFVRTGKGYSEYINTFNGFRNDEWFSDILSEPISENGLWSKWYKTKLDINSSEFIKNINIPVLFVWGQNDELIDVHKSMELAKSVTQNTNVQFKIFDNADHSLYAGGNKPVHLKYLKKWLTNKVKKE